MMIWYGIRCDDCKRRNDGMSLWYEMMVWTYDMKWWYDLMIWDDGMNLWYEMMVWAYGMRWDFVMIWDEVPIKFLFVSLIYETKYLFPWIHLY